MHECLRQHGITSTAHPVFISSANHFVCTEPYNIYNAHNFMYSINFQLNQKLKSMLLFIT